MTGTPAPGSEPRPPDVTSPPALSKAGRFLGAAAPFCAVWALAAVVHLVLSRVVSGTFLEDLSAPAWLQAGLIALELTLLAVLLALVAALRIPLAHLERRYPGRPARVLGLALRLLAVTAIVFGYAASWASFTALGQFADLQGLEFAWVNGSIFLGYVRAMHPGLVALLPAGSLAAAAAVVWGLPRLLALLAPPRRERAARIVLGIAAACVLVTAGVELLHGRADAEGVLDPVTGIVHSWGRIYEFRREATSGPLTHAASAALRGLAPRTATAEVRRESSQVLRRSQIRMADYVASVDRSSFRPRNVVMVLVDSMRPDTLESGGSTRPILRNVEAAAREGRFFSNARTEAPQTDYASICPLSSQYPLRSTSVHRYPPDPPYPRVLIYDLLKALGYRTGLISSQDEYWGLMANFLNSGGLDTMDHPHRPDQHMMRNFRRDDQTVDAAIRWLSEETSRPFFLHVNLQSAHFPYSVPADWPRRFGKKPDFAMSMGRYPRERAQDVRNLHADALDFIDAQIGRLIDALKGQGCWSETIFVLVADHGEAFLEHGFGGHAGQIYDEVMKVPIVFRGPGVTAGVDGRPAELIDVPPSLCHLLGIPSHPSFQGIDLFAPRPPKERSRFMVPHNPLASQFGVERGNWKLIVDDRMRFRMLFDLGADSGETRDVSREHPPILRELTRQAEEWRDLQVEYYQNPSRMATEYPPRIVDAAEQ